MATSAFDYSMTIPGPDAIPPAPASPTPVGRDPVRVAVLLASAMVLLLGVRYAASVFAPLLLAAFITAVSLPMLQWLTARRVPHAIAVLLVFLVNTAVLALAVWIVLVSAAQLGELLPAYADRLAELERAAQQRLRHAGIEPRTNLLSAIAPTERLVEYAGLAARGATQVLGTSVLVMLYVVFMLAAALDAPRVWQQYRGNRPSHAAEEVSTALRQVQRYLALKTLISMATGVLVGAGAWALDVDFALFWGFVAFVLNFIPNVGSIVAAIPAIATALLQLGAGTAVALAGIYLAVNMLIGNLADPIIIGRELRLAPLVVLVSLVVWGWVFGIIGMFLAVPLTLALRIVMQDSPRFEQYAQWLAPPSSDSPSTISRHV